MSGVGLATYVTVLRVPGVAAFVAATALVRLGQAMLGIGSVLLLVQTGHSYGVAGVVAGALSLAQGIVEPQVSRLVDAHGQRAVVLPQLLVHAVAVLALVVGAGSGGAAGLLVVAAVVAGAALPQAGALSRARWTALLTDGQALGNALAMESLVEEAVFVVGPVLVTPLATLVAPAAGLLTALALVVVGSVALVLQTRTEPGRQGRRTDAEGGALRPLAPLVSSFLAIGALFGLIEVGVVALSRQRGVPGASGLMLGLWAAGSLVAGTFYGARTWQRGAGPRFLLSAVGMAVGALLVAVAAVSGSLVLTTVALVVAGLANAPTLITGNVLVPTTVPSRQLTEAYTWLGVSVFAGIAVGSALGGLVIDRHGPQAALAAAVVAGVVVWAGSWWTARRSEAPTVTT